MTRREKWLVGFSHVSSSDVIYIFMPQNSVFLTADIIDQAQIATPIRVMEASIRKQC